MISPHTPPGTKVVCIDANANSNKKPGFNYKGDLDGLSEGQVYTVSHLQIGDQLDHMGEFEVVLVEIRRLGSVGYLLSRFRLAVLPSCLTDCLTSAPIRTRKTVGAA
jgi:hypothetical protein